MLELLNADRTGTARGVAHGHTLAARSCTVRLDVRDCVLSDIRSPAQHQVQEILYAVSQKARARAQIIYVQVLWERAACGTLGTRDRRAPTAAARF